MIKFDINGVEIEFSTEEINYINIRKLFSDKADFVSKKMFNNFKKDMFSFKKISSRGKILAETYLNSALKLAIETLVENNIITIDIDTFRSEYCQKYLDFERKFNNYSKSYLKSKKIIKI